MAKYDVTQEDVIRERWLRGRLGYKLHAGQHRIRDAMAAVKKQLFVGEISRQFGKTYLEVAEALECAFQIPNAKIKIGTAFQSDLLEFILPAFDAVMEDCPDDLKPVFKSQKSRFECPWNGSEIKLVGLDRKPNGMRGTVIDLIILDEAGFMSRLNYLYKSVIIPATTHRPHCRVLVFSTPPETPAHEFCDLAEKAEYEGGYCKLTIFDNPRVDEANRQRLMDESGGPNSTTWRREYLAERITDAELAIISDWDDKYLEDRPRDHFYPYNHKYVNMDLGVSDQTAATFGYYDFMKAQYVIEDEFVISGSSMNTKILQAHLKQKEMELWTEGHTFRIEDPAKISDREIDQINDLFARTGPKVYLRVADNNNPLLLQDLSYLHGLHFVPTDKGRLNEMVNTVKILVRGGGLIVHPRCKQTRGSLKYGIWDKNREKFAQSKVYGHFDALAAIIYGVRNLNRFTNPIPTDFGVDKMNSMVFPQLKESQSTKALKNAFGMKR